MNIVAAVFADFQRAFLGGPSLLHASLAGTPIIVRTLRRVAQINNLERRCLAVRAADEPAARAAVSNAGLTDAIEVLPLDDGRRSRRELIRCARVWNLDAWRGTPLGTTWFDEYVEPLVVARVMDRYGCEAALCLDACQPLLDLDIAQAMLRHQRERADDAHFVMTQAPPGLAGIILRRQAVRDLLDNNIPVGLLLSYRPESPRSDPVARAECLRLPAGIVQTAARFTADTRRSRELLDRALTDLGEPCTTVALCDWLRAAEPYQRPGPLPREVELELTTADPLPESRLRPRGARVPRRELDDPARVTRLAEELAQWDDRRLVLGGHGDPLEYPHFIDVCRRIRAAGVRALGVVTSLVNLSDGLLEELMDVGVDLVQVRIDANRAATYRGVHGRDCFAAVLTNITRVQKARMDRVCPQPILAPSLTRCDETLEELEAFFDRWVHTTGWAIIEGYNEYCGVLPPDMLLTLTPPSREPCRRLTSRLTLLADGTVPFCSQDVAATTSAGNWFDQSITDIWAGPTCSAAAPSPNRLPITVVRAAHAGRRWPDLPLCSDCHEWFRP